MFLHQHAVDGGGGEALIPEEDWDIGPGLGMQAGEVAGEGAVRLAARALGAVHVVRQADDHAGGATGLHQGGDGRDILVELGLADQAQGAGDGARGVGDGDADGLLPEVQPEHGRAVGQGGGESFEFKNGHPQGLSALFAKGKDVTPPS